MRRPWLWSPVLPLLVAVPACASHSGPKTEQAAGAHPVTISIVATNDVHGQLERLPVVSGFVANLRRARAKDGGVVLVDAGDAFQGTVESNMNEGAAAFAAYNQIGYAALALGNHDFDFGPPGPSSVASKPGEDAQGALKQRLGEAHFPVLGANLVGQNDERPPWKNLSGSSEILVGGVRVGFIGLLTETAADVIKHTVFEGLHVQPLAQAAAREAVMLRERGVKIVVVVAHAGGSCTRFDNPQDLSSCEPDSEIFRLARALPPGLVDVIVGGHRNAGVAHVVAGIPIVHAPSNLIAFSRVDLTVDPTTARVLDKRVFAPHLVCEGGTTRACVPGSYEGAPVVPDPATAAVIAPALAAAADVKNRDLGVNVVAPLAPRKDGETALANLFVDLMRDAAPGAEVALANAGSVRDTLPAGPLTFGRLEHVMPFDNQLARLRLTGAELRAVVAANLSQQEHGMLSVSGLDVEASCAGDQLVVTLERPDGARVRDDEQLTVVTSDFLALGGDGLLAAAHIDANRAELDPTKTVIDALIAGLQRRKSINPDELALQDPKHPRMKIPGSWPVHCGNSPAKTTETR